ncbi:uncharacterized protein LOC125551453 isoform X2 [Triticum urartu]|nr:uncharacterized protein LOC125526956 isoform X2 [Triticum urartu]XP_048570659.1 uncharacterized protein LOC125551453 isoform X2 [Triticum urartu]
MERRRGHAPWRGVGNNVFNQAGGSVNGGLDQTDGGSVNQGGGGGSGTGCDMDGEWIVTSELSFGSKKAMKGACGIRVSNEGFGAAECGCKLTPVIRVCNEGFDAGRRFLSCPYEGLNSCGYLRWMDDAWQGRSRVVIGKLANDNQKLQNALLDKEQDIQRMKKERNKLDEQRKSREKLDLFLVLVVLASVVIYALVALVSRGFV